MTVNLESLAECFKAGLQYLPVTLGLTVIAVCIGVVFGGLIAMARVFRIPFLGRFFDVFITVYSGIPMVVALMIFNLVYLTQFNDWMKAIGSNLTTKEVSNIWVAGLAISLLALVHISEAIRGAFASVDPGQYEAGYTVGLTKWQTIRRIIIPQVIPVAVPVLCTNTIGIMKSTSIVMAIGVMELLNGSILPCQKTYSFLEGYLAAALIYWALSIALSYLAKYLEEHLGKFRRKLA